jgi:flagellar transcriptional activator FlhD
MTTMERDFYELNLAYLHAARELARQDPSQAVTRLGLSLDLIGALADIGIEDMHRLASSSFLMFQPRGNSHQLLEMIRARGDGIPRIAHLLSTLATPGEAR